MDLCCDSTQDRMHIQKTTESGLTLPQSWNNFHDSFAPTSATDEVYVMYSRDLLRDLYVFYYLSWFGDWL